MKFEILTENLWSGISKLKMAMSISKIVDKVVQMEVKDEQLYLSSQGATIFAEVTIPIRKAEDGLAILRFESFQAFQYVNGVQTFELNNDTIDMNGCIDGSLAVYKLERQYDMPTVECENWATVGSESFNILYPIDGRELELEAVFIRDNLMVATNRKSYAGYKNDSLIAPSATIHPNLFKTITKDQFDICIVNNFVRVKQDNIVVTMPVLHNTFDVAFTYGYYDDLGDVFFEIDKDAAKQIANVVHALSTGEYENNDGRGSLQLKDDKVFVEAKGNEIGKGTLSGIECIESNGEFSFGLSTNLFKGAISNVDSSTIKVYRPLIDGKYQVLIVVGDKTLHFLAEDPNAR